MCVPSEVRNSVEDRSSEVFIYCLDLRSSIELACNSKVTVCPTVSTVITWSLVIGRSVLLEASMVMPEMHGHYANDDWLPTCILVSTVES